MEYTEERECVKKKRREGVMTFKTDVAYDAYDACVA